MKYEFEIALVRPLFESSGDGKNKHGFLPDHAVVLAMAKVGDMKF